MQGLVCVSRSMHRRGPMGTSGGEGHRGVEGGVTHLLAFLALSGEGLLLHLPGLPAVGGREVPGLAPRGPATTPAVLPAVAAASASTTSALHTHTFGNWRTPGCSSCRAFGGNLVLCAEGALSAGHGHRGATRRRGGLRSARLMLPLAPRCPRSHRRSPMTAGILLTVNFNLARHRPSAAACATTHWVLAPALGHNPWGSVQPSKTLSAQSSNALLQGSGCTLEAVLAAESASKVEGRGTFCVLTTCRPRPGAPRRGAPPPRPPPPPPPRPPPGAPRRSPSP